MRQRHPLLRAVTPAVVLVLLLAAPAHANHVYIGTSDATGLELTLTAAGVGAQTVSFATSAASVQSAPVAACAGTACATAVVAGDEAEVVVTDRRASDTADSFAVPQGLAPFLDGEIGVAEASATPAPAPTATGETESGTVRVLLPPDESADTDDASSVLADVTIGATASTARDSAPGQDGVTTATATTGPAILRFSPDDDRATEGLVRVEVGEASATATTNQRTASADFDVAVVRLFTADLTTDAPDDYGDPITVVPGEDDPTCAGESPERVCVAVAEGDETSRGAEAGAVSGVVEVTAFAAAAEPGADTGALPGLTFTLASASAGVNAAPPGSPQPREPLPRTGGGLVVPGLAVLAVGALLATALRRRP